jgi:pyruvate dehydrogenase E1 component beta subunit
MPEQTYIEAIRSGLAEEMARDPAVYVLGEDVTLGGPFGATKGLAEEFGANRVINTPISEGTVMGIAIGAAAAGLRPVVEVMFMDFITLGMDQLVNHAAKLHYVSGGQLKVPLTVRVQAGVSGSAGAHHSQSFESWFMHVPGLKVIVPSNAADAKGLLKSAIRDDNPVLYIEHRGLYWTRTEVPDGDHIVPLGAAALLRVGNDVTVLAFSRMVQVALEAAGELELQGISVEIIDPRSLYPLDLDKIAASVRKTSRLVIVHEAVQTGGTGAELAARVQEAALDYLDSPIIRVGAPFTPVPFSPALEKEFLPTKDAIVKAVHQTIRF